MLSVTEIKINPLTDKARVSIFADSKSDVNYADAVKLVGRELDAGSSIMTANAEVAFVKSDGSLSWV